MNLRIAVYEDEDRTGLNVGESRWLARDLGYEFFGVSETREEALKNLLRAVACEVVWARSEGRTAFEGLPSTDRGFLSWWEKGEHTPLDVPPSLAELLPEGVGIAGIWAR